MEKEGCTVSDHFFDMFSADFIKGSPSAAINDLSSIVLLSSAAKALFGNADPINKVIRIDNDHDVKVTAIVADVPENTTLRFDYIMPTCSEGYVKLHINRISDLLQFQKRI